ncbi:type I polyketide synthase [Actinokineospora cianjurensis]|uniref:Acyl transferase domain-containing protein n=1 Tax=Actinokineospora cianjurensis TaxID=585224 RepID=A0A421BAU7_9PSEU|nr:type I polyketide synthase [Actinokineospora cianjurensis]RLK61350.1 acyl transferase domain-containing protein [Actinokineospora cianjurensis]
MSSPDYDALLRKALARIEHLEAELDLARVLAPEPVAVVGIGCRFPGADGPDEFWRLLVEGRDAITEVPPDRWDVDAYHDPDPDRPGRMTTRYGGFVPDPAGFDTAAFGISAREAAGIDPQQRMLLEVTWQAFEHAGMPVRELPGRTGVYVGISNVDYREAMVLHGEDSIDGYFSSGSTTSTASGRLSYFLGLTGPSLSVDTACSSSSVALHLAARDLRTGACDVAVAGGVNQILTPHETISLSKARMMAPDGRCKPFSAAANGYVRAEGCGMVVLKRLSDAQRDGDDILAVVLGSATNQDGRRSGLTVPHGPSQQAVIREALRDAGLSPTEVGYVETHGTGTALGDPIEAAALGAVFGERDRPLVLGAVKSNLGHLESAAGIAGVIKAVLSVRHGVIPGTLHFDEPSPYVDWSLPLRVPTTTERWPEGRRVAGISSFGFSGSNCHIVLADPVDPRPEKHGPIGDRLASVVTVSAASESALRAAQRRLAEFAAGGAGGANIHNVSYTAATARSHFEHRAAVVASTLDELAERASAAKTGYVPAGHRAPNVAFLFTGQGAQYPKMGASPLWSNRVFALAVSECEELLAGQLDPPLNSLLASEPDEETLARTEYAQVVLFVYEYAMARVWQSCGVTPVALLGHSVGELAAACLAGVFSLEDALRVVVARGRLMQALPDGGVMVSLRGDRALVEQVVARHPLVGVAAVNGPEEIVISGDSAQVNLATDELAAQGVTGRELKVSHAFHSPLMHSIVDEFTEVLRGIPLTGPTIPIVSTVTGRLVGDEMTDPAYWVRQALEPVLFADGVRALDELGARVFIEVGPQPVLSALGRALLPGDDYAWLPSARRNSEFDEHAKGLAELYVRGYPIDWAGYEKPYLPHRQRVALPSYPFQRERHWFAPESTSDDQWLHQVMWEPTSPQAPVDTVDTVRFEPEPSHGDPVAHTHRLAAELLALVKDITARPKPPRLRVITRNAHALTPGETTDPAHTALWGLIHTIAAEHPEVRLTAVDTDDIDLPTNAPFTVIRRGIHHWPKLGAAATPDKVDLGRDGTYLVTGGLGALGLRTASELAKGGAGTIVLTSRREPSADQRARIAEIERFATVRIHQADISDAAAVAALLQEHGPLRGIVHAAGVLDDAILAQQSAQRFDAVLAPKVDGAWHLHQQATGLDFFVAFSSVSAFIPTFASGAYAAANAFLDGLMAHRRAAGLPGAAIQWGPWSGIGMAATESHEKSGLRMLSPDRGARLAIALAGGENVAVLNADWAKLSTTTGAAPGFFGVEPDEPQTGPSLRTEIDAAKDKVAFLGEQVELILRDVLGERSELGRHQGFFSMGMDSLMAVEFHARLTAALAIAIPPTAVFKYATLDDLVPHLADEIGIGPQETIEEVDDTSAADLLARITRSANTHLDED